MIAKKWIILPCKVPGNDSEPSIDDIYNRFTGPGGLKAYWYEVTLGLLEISFVKANQWLSPQIDAAGYPGANHSLRQPFFQACIKAAQDEHVPVEQADGIMVFLNAPFDLWGETAQVVCDIKSDHNDIAHELGHGLGLNHTFGAVSPALLVSELSVLGRSPYFFLPNQYLAIEYGDKADIMSVNNVWDKDGRGPRPCGPMLLNLSATLGAMLPGQILMMPLGDQKATVQLSPLYDQNSLHPNLFQFLIDHGTEQYSYFVEFRLPESWDEGFPNAGLIVHERRPSGEVLRLYHDKTSDPDAYPSKESSLSPLSQGQELVDPTRKLRVKALRIDLPLRNATVEIEIGSDPRPFEQRFRAANAWAARHGFVGAFPNFHEAEYGPGWHYQTILLNSAAVEWKDISAAALGNPMTFDARFRAVNDWAAANGYVSGFPNFHEGDYSRGTVYGTLLIRPGFADWADVPTRDLGYPATPEARIAAVNDWARANGYLGAIPNFHEADYGTVYGTILVKRGAADWKDISVDELNNPTTLGELFRAVNDWAHRNGYLSGFPNFFEADFGQGTVYGTLLVKPEAADWRDIPVADLGNPTTPEERFRAVNDWANRKGYLSAFPNFHEGDHGHGKVYGAILIKGEFAVWQDIPLSELVFP